MSNKASKRVREDPEAISAEEQDNPLIKEVKEQDDDDLDIGPSLPTADDVRKKKKRALAHEKLYLDHLPSADMYERSYMHRDVLNYVAVTNSDHNSNKIYIYDGRGDSTPLYILSDIYSSPVHLMAAYHCVVSIDSSGMIEYWSPDEPFDLPKTVSFEYKSDTDLYEFKKSKSVPISLTFSPDYQQFVTMSIDDRQVRVFRFSTGKLTRKYDESLAVMGEMQQAGTTIYKLDDMEFGRRLAVELFDESGNFIIYPTMLGIKVVNLITNKVVRLIGKTEPHRFLNMSLYQGAPKKKMIVTLAMAASDNPLMKESEATDPTIFCTAFKRNRFFMFTQREPDAHDSHKGDRDVYNEKPSREEQTVASATPTKQKLGNTAILRTTSGDIHIRLFPEYAPKAVENFVTHAKNGYYNNVIFHRVIKGFMIQTGDPL
ncbi:27760_t:CDS:10, partial [Racocetra persica]